MTAIHIDIDHASPPHSGTTFFDCRRARMRAQTDTGLTVISISGEIDASNADTLNRRASELASEGGALIVDLAEVDFLTTASSPSNSQISLPQAAYHRSVGSIV